MASEIQFNFTTGRTCYVLLRSATGTIWNGSSFEAYVTANYATYDIAATEQGTASGLYAATMPAVAGGEYRVIAKDRAGGSPAESDITIGTGIINWSGTAVVNPSNLDAAITTRPTLAQILAGGDVDGYSLEETLKLCLAALAGKLSGAASTTITIRSADDTVDRIIATVDVDGNRSAVTLDATG
jgi:hypothetical protein